jgi:hypothetical protein
MLCRFRGWTGAVAASLVVTLGTLWAPHSADPHHDAEYALSFVAHDETAHRVTSAESASDTRPLHCLVCHLVRLMRRHAQTREVTAPHPEVIVRVHTEVFTASSSASVVQPPLRSPPASPIFL